MALLNLTYSAGTHGSSSKYETKIDIKETSVNVSSNTSVISFSLYTIFSGGSGAWAKAPYGATGYINIAGQRYDFGKLPYDFRSTTKKVWYSGSKTVTHNSDGSKTIDTNFYINFDNSFIGTASATRNGLSLDTIPRKSSFTLSASSLTMGNPMTVTIQPASSSFSHIVYMKYGTSSYANVIASIPAGSKTGSFTPAVATWAPSNITGTSGTATVMVRTMNGSTLIGESYKTFTLTIPTSVKPTANHTLTPVNRLGTAYASGISSVNISNSFEGTYGSTLKSYSTVIKAGTTTIQSSNGQTLSSGVLTISGSITITTTVTDSRGRIGTKTSTITVESYMPPIFKNPKIFRSTATGIADDNGSYMILGGTPQFTNVGGNKGTFTVEYKDKRTTTWTVGFTQTGIVGSVTKTQVFPAVTETTYDVRVTLKDALKTVVYNYEVSSSVVLLDFLASGDGIAIGKSATRPFVFELASKYSILGGSPTLIGGNTNLNDITDMGAYIQTQNAWATTALNYPEAQAGFLEVFNNGNGTYPYILQRYTHYLNRTTWSRTKYSNAWQPWRLIAGSIDIKNSVLVTNPEGATVVSAVQSADFVSLELSVSTSKTGWITLCRVNPSPTAGIVVGIRPSESSEMSKVYNGRILANGNIHLYIGTAISGSMHITVVYPY